MSLSGDLIQSVELTCPPTNERFLLDHEPLLEASVKSEERDPPESAPDEDDVQPHSKVPLTRDPVAEQRVVV